LAAHIDFIKPGVKMMPVVKRSVQGMPKVKRDSLAFKKLASKISVEDDIVANLAGSYPAAAGNLSDDLQGCGLNMTPTCYRALYDIPIPTSATEGLGVGLYEQGDYFAESDLDATFASFAPWVPNGTYPISAVIDGAQYSFPANATDRVGGEANLDIYIAWV
jgi:tripeptidyl-peptidase I